MRRILLVLFLVLISGIFLSQHRDWPGSERENKKSPEIDSVEEMDCETMRNLMVANQLVPRGIRHQGVLNAMRTVPRHEFVPRGYEQAAYGDYPLSIGYGQTISQPYIVALMTELAALQPTDRVLEIGTGSGYQAAILSMLAKTVFSMEIIPELAERADATLKRLGYDNVMVKRGNGYAGWPEEAPFDVILVTAAPEEIPQTLVDQLAPSGRMVMPVGPEWSDQTLVLVSKDAKGKVHYRNVTQVSFVPMLDRPKWGGTSGNRDRVE